ncbi:pyridoxamine 5'-phosphate oxidase [Pedobacter yulinensis]|uniref:Pyridoxine/pyridoxamine 5'-phosphate oxidase n=1 Tax=Pedobacter yulinensis TaxID=2126353 RepID=A0A2T3HKI3_9SPHI|nr:pyridoxamine 5'-phosphate oxidase [Pedobacter yulinensis]PST82965.1 pyridoxamine 5'-phosphate oxidase [Pedobacter yulinensis]
MQITTEFIQNLRQDYRNASLEEKDTEADPILQFAIWFENAVQANIYEPNVMTVATANAQGRPSARILLLKGYDQEGFVFYTNYNSRKGDHLAENPQAALLFFWDELERQVRIEGTVSKIGEERSVQYFQSRPRGSQIGAAASPQSRVIPDRAYLEDKVNMLTAQFDGQDVPKPLEWGGYQLRPDYVEFWQGRPSRLHDRIAYRLMENGIWVKNRLAP